MGARNLDDVFVYITIFGVFFLFLNRLLWYAKESIESRIFTVKEDDEFYKKYGYTYEYVLVFAVHDEMNELSKQEKLYSVNNVYQRLKNAELDAKCFFSCQRDEVYIKVRVGPERLQKEARRINYRMLVRPDRLRKRLTVGKKRNGEWIWRPINITDAQRLSSINPFVHIYAPYNDDAAADGLFEEYPAYNNCKHIFRGVDR
jgi:hypothetical protein